MTKNHRTFDRAVVISSVIQSEKNYCAGSVLIFWNGSTAMRPEAKIGRFSRVTEG
jgi:hypothetical protein